MKITRETVEKILREEIAAVTEAWPGKGNPFTKASGEPQPKQPDPWATAHTRGGPGGSATHTPPKKPPVPMTPKSPDEHAEDIKYGSRGYDPRNRPVEEGLADVDVDPDNDKPPGLGPQAEEDLPVADPSDETGEAELMELLNLLEGHMGQEAPPVENDQRARELLDGFKNMLKPQERAEPSACATFLRQLADMAEREGGAPDAGTMPEPLPNN